MLYNPFRRLTMEVLEKWITATPYVVAQHFRRAFPYYSPGNKTGLLLTPYQYLFDAEKHLHALVDQRYAALIQLQHPNHLNTIQNLLLLSSDYLLFDGATPQLNEKLKHAVQQFHPKIFAYLNREVDIDPVTTFPAAPRLEIHYGEIYLLMGTGSDQLKIKLETIEQV